MIEDNRGIKRTCQGCGARFYDLNSNPIVCPKCDKVFELQSLIKSRRGKAAALNLDGAKDVDSILFDSDLGDDIVADVEDHDLIEDTDLDHDMDDFSSVSADEDMDES